MLIWALADMTDFVHALRGTKAVIEAPRKDRSG
jgi:hypothetical protein